MAMVNLSEVLNKAREGGYAVPAITFYTYEDLRAIMAACNELKSPIILMNGPRTLNFIGMKQASFLAHEAAKEASVPVVLHLDHAIEEKMVVQAMNAGFTSVMYDCSHLPFDENVEKMRFIVRAAHYLDISVEGEIGQVGMGEEGEDVEEVLTDPDSALAFADQTGVDALAVAVGTSHGMQTRNARIHFDLVDLIRKKVSTPIVLHGSSGVSDDDLKKSVEMGISKINIATRLKFAFINELRAFFESGVAPKDHVEILEKGMAAQTEEMRSIIRVLGSEGRG